MDQVAAEVLRCAHLSRRFGARVAVDGVGFTIAAGETYGLLGPNGAGKTTTIRMICGLLRPDDGTITVAGSRVRPGRADAKERIGYVPQDIALYPDLTARENLRFFGRLYRLGRRQLEQRIEEVLGVLDLGDRGDDRVDAFSGGMKRRLNIGAALLHRPALLVLDEPTVGVDPQSRNHIFDSVAHLSAGGMAVLYTTHYMEEAERLCDRVGIIDRGHLIAEGTRRELVDRLGHSDSIELTATGDLARYAQACADLPDVVSAKTADGEVQVLAAGARHLLPSLLELAERNDVAITSVEVSEPDLEDVFLDLTGTALRE